MTELSQRIFVAFDTETTGLLPESSHVVEIAGVRFTGTGDEISRFSTLANPGAPISAEVTRIHGINDAMVARAPDSTEACRQFASWLDEDDILVAHNAPFDVAFISTELTRGRFPSPRNRVIDSLLCARLMDLTVPNYKLGTLVDHFGFPETGYHRAMADSLYVMQLILAFMKRSSRLTLHELAAQAGVLSHFETAPSTVQLLPRFATLHEAMDRGEVVTMRYDGEDRSVMPQRILPLTLSTIADQDYLVAQCMHDGSVKQFRLDRIIALSEANAGTTYRRA